MAKHEKDKNSQEVENINPETQPFAEPQAPPVMQVEKQSNAHNEIVYNPRAALQPGRPFVASDGLMGEIEKMHHEAEKSGDKVLASELHLILLNVGGLLVYLNDLEKNAKGQAKQLYLKISSLFK